ncbi:hypothetical protein OROGR_009871 [Orobanche gracilis]
MGTYFPMPNNQRDTPTMLYSRNCLPNSHSETPVFPSDTIMYTNYLSSTDIQPSDSSTSHQQILFDFGGGIQEVGNQWKDGRNDFLNSSVIQGCSNLQGQGLLSLSLGTNVHSVLQMPSIQYQNNDNTNFSSVLGNNGLIAGENEDYSFRTKQTRGESDYMLFSVPSNSDVANDVAPYGTMSIARAVSSSKYLRAAQQLLDEAVNVKKDVREHNARNETLKDSKEKEGGLGNRGSDPADTPKASGNSSNDLSVAEKQELQNKITKLLSMLDEVDIRYRQYYHQMQIVVSSFDMIAGSGAAKPYTSLALHTISRHFRSLRDAISAQIVSARKSLGEEDASSNDKGVGISRLRYVDRQLRQQRALQQLGIMQQHAWRPQRGLPETSVSVLRAWLFEHFLHPYPKDSEKIMLARQAGLTRSQVSNWFINARVRLWKPMVEEMYKEETDNAVMDSNSSSEKTNTKDNKAEDSHQATTSTGQHQLIESKHDRMTDIDMMGSDNISVFHNVMHNDYGIGKIREGQNSLFPDENTVCQTERFMSDAYHISELERFGNVDLPVSLTLGLQQCESDHGFNPLREGVVYSNAASAMANETADFDCMDSGNREHQFVSSLLPSFS